MQEIFSNLALGMQTAMTWTNILWVVIGGSLGTIIGMLPGLGPATGVAVLIPITFGMNPATALITMCAVYYGAMFGGSRASIMINVPGDASAIVSCFDGYPMTKQGRAGPALAISAIASFIGGMIGVVLVIAAAIPMARIALRFGAPEYAMLVVLGLMAATLVGTGSQLRSLAMVLVGVALGLIGADTTTGFYRFVAMPELADGVSLVSLAMGLFGVSEIIRSVNSDAPPQAKVSVSMRDILPTRAELRSVIGPILRGAGVGSFFGALPGTGAAIASFMSYAVEKRVSRTPGKFGTGHLPGIAAPESSNNAAAQTSFIPTLTLGVPGDAVMALMIGALVLNGVIPGPRLMVDQPTLFWGVIASFVVGNLVLLLINIPLIRLWVLLLRIPYRKLYPVITIMICVGVYSHRSSVVDVALTLAFGVIGYLLKNYRFEPAPLLLGFVLGPLFEENFRRAMLLNGGDFTVFATRPISATLLACTVLLLAYSLFS
ncbi:MAG: hypothetical protein CVV53_01345, partial [Spirochaetae bacterium HGW-Spirochaetae-9]